MEIEINFEQLTAALNITPTYQHEAQLLALEKWCIEHISTDIKYTGNNSEKYILYVALIRDYVTHFLPQIKTNFSNPNPALDHLNAVQYAALHGYDIFLRNNSIPTALLDAENTNKMTPLHLACISGHVNTTKALLAQGANPLHENGRGQLPIQSVLLRPIMSDEFLIKQKEATFKVLFEYNQDSIAHKDNEGNTAVHGLAAGGFDALLNEVLHHNQTCAFYHNNHMRYPIHSAILNNNLGAATLLFSIDKVNTLKDAQMRTALHYAARYSAQDMLAICCLAASDINQTDTEGKTALELAREAGIEENVQFLVAHGATEP